MISPLALLFVLQRFQSLFQLRFRWDNVLWQQHRAAGYLYSLPTKVLGGRCGAGDKLPLCLATDHCGHRKGPRRPPAVPGRGGPPPLWGVGGGCCPRSVVARVLVVVGSCSNVIANISSIDRGREGGLVHQINFRTVDLPMPPMSLDPASAAWLFSWR